MKHFMLAAVFLFPLLGACKTEHQDASSAAELPDTAENTEEKKLSKINDAELSIVYLRIAECKETVENDNAAVSVLSCPDLAGIPVSLVDQAPSIFNIVIGEGDASVSTDFYALTDGQPLQPGSAMEWHLRDGRAESLIFRLKWGPDANPQSMREYLTVSRVMSEEICTFAAVDVRKHAKANEVARGLLKNAPMAGKKCPQVKLY